MAVYSRECRMIYYKHWAREHHNDLIFILLKLSRSLTRMTKCIKADQQRENYLALDEINDIGGHLKIKFLIMTLTASV